MVRSARPLPILALVLQLAACGVGEAVDRGFYAAESCGGFPATPSGFAQSIEPLASYEPQEACDPTPRPGVVAFRDLVLATYACTSDGGIARECDVGGVSEHKEGRAWDWMVEVGNQAADDLIAWLLATDEEGNEHAMARRLGVMYMVWNGQIWGAHRADEGWRPYTGDNPHTDHVHLSFSSAGAAQETSFWSGTAATEPTCVASAERCDGRDNNCDGEIDEGDPGGGAFCLLSGAESSSWGSTVCTGGRLVCWPVDPGTPPPPTSADELRGAGCAVAPSDVCAPTALFVVLVFAFALRRRRARRCG